MNLGVPETVQVMIEQHHKKHHQLLYGTFPFLLRLNNKEQ